MSHRFQLHMLGRAALALRPLRVSAGGLGRPLRYCASAAPGAGHRERFDDDPPLTTYNGNIWANRGDHNMHRNVQFSGMELMFFGTGSAIPSPPRNTSSLALRLQGMTWLFDCGEGTQSQIYRTPLTLGSIKRIFITHLHGDHVNGLPGLVVSICQFLEQETRVLEIYGPKGLYEFLEVNLRLTRSDRGRALRGMLRVHELVTSAPGAMDSPPMQNGKSFLEHAYIPPVAGSTHWEIDVAESDGGASGSRQSKQTSYTMTAAPLRHSMPCVGYVVQESDKPGQIDEDECRRRGLTPGPAYGELKAGRDVQLPCGGTLRAEEVVAPAKLGRKVVILGDTADSREIEPLARGADVLVHESTLPDRERRKALSVGHSTPVLAGQFAKKIAAHHLVLTHFSNKHSGYNAMKGFTREAIKAFGSKRVVAAKDFSAFPIPRRGEQVKIMSVKSEGSGLAGSGDDGDGGWAAVPFQPRENDQ